MIAGIIREIEGRRGSQTRLDEGGRYLGIPGDRPFHRIVSDRVDGKTRQSALFTVQETGCDTDDHNPPHFHAEYGEHEALVNINTLAILGGSLPARALGLVAEWASLHQQELRQAWDRAKQLRHREESSLCLERVPISHNKPLERARHERAPGRRTARRRPLSAEPLDAQS